jgi:hypothetical protein
MLAFLSAAVSTGGNYYYLNNKERIIEQITYMQRQE